MLHLSTRSRDEPAASRQRFICSSTNSACRSKGARLSSPVSGSNGGRPATKTSSPATVTGKIGPLRRRSRYVENGSTRIGTRFISHFLSFRVGHGVPSLSAWSPPDVSREDEIWHPKGPATVPHRVDSPFHL